VSTRYRSRARLGWELRRRWRRDRGGTRDCHVDIRPDGGGDRTGRCRRGRRHRGGRQLNDAGRLRRFGDGGAIATMSAGGGPTTSGRSCGGSRGCTCRRFVGLYGATQAVAISLATDAVGLGILDGRRVALHADPELDAQVERFFIRESELSAELVDADLLRQLALRSSLQGRARRSRWPPARLLILAHRRRYREPGHEIRTQVVPATAPRPGRPAQLAGSSVNSVAAWLVAIGTRSARENALRRTARSRHSADPEQSQAPRPVAVRLTTRLSPCATIRTSSCWLTRRRHPTQVRTGPATDTAASGVRRRRLGRVVVVDARVGRLVLRRQLQLLCHFLERLVLLGHLDDGLSLCDR
jgi:hypothetical protein